MAMTIQSIDPRRYVGRIRINGRDRMLSDWGATIDSIRKSVVGWAILKRPLANRKYRRCTVRLKMPNGAFCSGKARIANLSEGRTRLDLDIQWPMMAW